MENAQLSGGAMLVLGIVIAIVIVLNSSVYIHIRLDSSNSTNNWWPC